MLTSLASRDESFSLHSLPLGEGRARALSDAMRSIRVLTRRNALKAGMGAMLTLGPVHRLFAAASKGTEAAIRAGREFLVAMFDPSMDLLPEYRGSKTFWLYHDNYLAAHVLTTGHPSLAEKIRGRIKSFGIERSGKIEIVLGEAKDPLPFRQYELMDVAQVGDKLVRTERATDRILEGWEEYADLLLLASLAERDSVAATRAFDKANALWDGKGLRDRVVEATGIHATYKLGLLLIAAKKLDRIVDFHNDVAQRLLTLQDKSGGWITDYKPDGTPVGLANVETTCLVILAMETFV